MLGYVLYTFAVGIVLLLYVLNVFSSLDLRPLGLPLNLNIALLVSILAGYKIVYQAMLDLVNRRLSADLAIVVAAVAAVVVGQYFAAAEVMFIMLVGEGIEHYTVTRSKRAIAGFVEMTPTMARVRRNGQELQVRPEDVQVEDVVIIRAGEKVPVDGIVVQGQSSIDESMITGEPIPSPKKVGDWIYSGSVNEYGLLEARAERVGEQTTLARIARLIAAAQKERAPIERTADRFAKYFLPAILVVGGAIYYFTGDTLRAVAALIVVCPCALVLATPAALAAAIARLAREGVLVKGGGHIESLARINCVAFDKTGTLTAGRPSVEAVVPAPGVREEHLLALASAAERSSEHLLGREIVAEARRRQVDIPEAQEFLVRPGLGVQARVQDRLVRVGNMALVREVLGPDSQWAENMLAGHSHSGQTAVLVVVDDRIMGIVGLRDRLRSDAAETVLQLKELGIPRICMVTGDEEAAAQYIGRRAGIAEVHARLLPEEKGQKIRQLRSDGSRVLMIGDGVNDSPSLAMADVGIAMGRGAADISAEAAHVVFLRDCLEQIPDLLVFARKVIQRIKSSILLFALGVNLLAIVGAAVGWLGPVAAAIVHQSASLFVILNCVRLLVEGKAIQESRLFQLQVAWRQRFHRLQRALGAAGLRRFAGALAANRREVRNWSLGLLIGLFFLSGITVINPEQVGVVQRFGAWVGELNPGIHYRWPWPVEKATRMAPSRIQVIEVGYRTNLVPTGIGSEPQVYEWNIQHRLGRYRKVPEEALMLTGDENMVEVNGVVQYRISSPRLFLFTVKEPEMLMRTAAEEALRLSVARQSLDAILTSGRLAIQLTWKAGLEQKLTAYNSGLEVLSVRLQDVHPPVEVVEAFRDVASALEEKITCVNVAESYLREQLPLARGQSTARKLSAEAYSSVRVERSRGDSTRFTAREQAYRKAPEVTALRLYLETVEQVLPNKTKFIMDPKTLGRRRFLFLDAKDLNLLTVVEPQK